MWQACHLATSAFILRGMGGTWSHPPSYCVAGVALMALGGALVSVLEVSEVSRVAGLAEVWHVDTMWTTKK